MTTAAPAASTYLRGAAPSAVSRPLRTSIVAAGLAIIMTFAAVLVAETHQENARLDRLASAGVPVLARVTRCMALASGTGVTGAGASCQAAFTLDGHRYVAMLHANAVYRQPGDTIRAVTTRSNPSDLTVGTPRRASWTGYGLPATLLILVALGFGVSHIRHPRPRYRPHGQPLQPTNR